MTKRDPMQLNLANPLVFLDLETTGINISKDRIVEIAILKIFPSGKEESKTRRINPEMPIPPEATGIHGITDDDVKDCPTFKTIARSLATLIEGCDLAGFNSNRFDIPLLAEEFLRAGVDIDLNKRKFVDVQTIFHKMEQRTLAAACKFYCNKELDNAHNAEIDTRATYEVLKAQLERYPELQNDIKFLSGFSTFNSNVDFAGRMIYNEKREEVINFGKYKGRLVTEVLSMDPSYYTWVMNGDFSLNTKKMLTEIRLRTAQGKK
jgi:DNA polymerase-3 subunit epsilon